MPRKVNKVADSCLLDWRSVSCKGTASKILSKFDIRRKCETSGIWYSGLKRLDAKVGESAYKLIGTSSMPSRKERCHIPCVRAQPPIHVSRRRIRYLRRSSLVSLL